MAAMRARTLAIARGTRVPQANDPKVWFTSIESLAQVLSSRNQVLLEIIQRSKPSSMRGLARVSGRAESNLSRTLRRLERYRLVRLRDEDGRKIPEVPYQRLEFAMPIAAPEPMKAA